jgi:multidrug efflux pump subunit AcrA (membrane-fusion protein)
MIFVRASRGGLRRRQSLPLFLANALASALLMAGLAAVADGYGDATQVAGPLPSPAVTVEWTVERDVPISVEYVGAGQSLG